MVQTDISEPRRAVVKQAFQFLDEEGKGAIQLDFLKKKYCAAAHPRVRTREKEEEKVQAEFEAAISKKAQ